MEKLDQVTKIGQDGIRAILREIEKCGLRVRLHPAVATDEDLGRICGSTIEVVEDPLERTIEAFTLCHLFGHMIQFTTLSQYEKLLGAVSGTPPTQLSDNFWSAFYAYELEAYGYGGTLLENSLPADDVLRSRYATFMELDFNHFRIYTTTGNRLDRTRYREKLLQSYNRPVTTLIKPLPISGVNWSNLSTLEARII